MAEEEIPTTGGEESSGKSRLKLLIMVIGGAVIIAMLSVAATWFLIGRGGGDEEVAPPAPEEIPLTMPEQMQTEGPAIYLALQPPFIVNYSVGARTRFLQLELSIVARDPAAIDVANTYMPLIRNNLLETLSEQDFNYLRTAQGKMDLVEELTDTIQEVMEMRLGRPGIETVLFRSFVMQ
ncbi:flagellar basal body-associated FliL family protein [Saccharospirillum mangrovi]|uniref:flagellar basal body-associated FliL family protein n=1 Tax=Saccharospirillum mangrovi TaxID=2161747 RepID=UPI000D3B8896|nr:flagellar basal body-associated FliL family protein [Saccharospirillum mangrovi]